MGNKEIDFIDKEYEELVNYIKSYGGFVDEKLQTVRVYHATNLINSKEILETKIMKAKEDGLFFSTRMDGQIVGYGSEILALEIPISKLEIDDVFDNELHFRLPLKNTYSLDVSKYLIEPRFFIDLDGTEAHFNNSIESLDVLHEEGYYRHLVPQQNVVDAVNVLIDKYPNQVFILSAVLNSPYAAEDKRAWVKEHNPNLPDKHLILCPYGESKHNYVPGGIKQTDVLLDDYTNNLIAWKKAGGQPLKLINGINHTNRTWEGSSVHYLDKELSRKIEHFSSGDEIKEFLNQEVSVLSVSIHYQNDDFESIKEKLKELNALFAKIVDNANTQIEVRVSLKKDGIDILKNEKIEYENIVKHKNSIDSNKDYSLVEILKEKVKNNILAHRDQEQELIKFTKLENLFEKITEMVIVEESVVIDI